MAPEFDPRYFEQETPRVAYHGGMLTADGCLTLFGKSARLSVNLQCGDREYLEWLRQDLGAFHTEVRDYDQKAPGGHIGVSVLSVQHPDLIVGLRRWGVVPLKTRSGIAPAPMPPGLTSHYVRGLIDGDGWVRLVPAKGRSARPTIILVCHEAVARWLQDNVPWTPLVYDHPASPAIRRVHWTGCRKVRPLIEWLGYTNPSLPALSRKRASALECVNHVPWHKFRIARPWEDAA